jgi:hypothetical protein
VLKGRRRRRPERIIDHNRTSNLMLAIAASYISYGFEVIGLFSILFIV